MTVYTKSRIKEAYITRFSRVTSWMDVYAQRQPQLILLMMDNHY